MRLFADECIPSVVFRDFVARTRAADPSFDGMHLLDWQKKQGVKDDEWVPALASIEPHYLVITGDKARKTRTNDPRLPRILPAFGVTAAFMSGKLQQSRADVKIQVIEALLPALSEAYLGKRGARYRIEAGAGRPKLTPWPG